jgi:pimeloyl-ACP methyl ester carboxylesterase
MRLTATCCVAGRLDLLTYGPVCCAVSATGALPVAVIRYFLKRVFPSQGCPQKTALEHGFHACPHKPESEASTMSRWYRTARVLLLGMLLLLEGCMFSTLRDELTEMERVHALTGRIFKQTRPETNVLLILYQQTPGGLRISQGTILSSAVGRFVVEVPNGTFYLFAFEDLDSDLAWDGREPSGYYGSPDPIVVTDRSPQTLKELDIYLNAPAARPDGFPEAVSLSAEKLGRSVVKIGQVVGFDDPILSPEYGNKGYWEPLTFIREVGICLFFREKFDPAKIPVLFVHGALGTPIGWTDIVERLDPARFQTWFYYYPSGLSLETTSAALNWMVNHLHRHYGFRELYVVAHSMGGLVARSFILKNGHENRQDIVKRFVSISTPWNGHTLTAKGVRQAPAAVPSWHDMVPESPFIRSIFARRLPESVTYDLFFSYRGDCSLFLENNDGTVELASELDMRAQREARRIYGYDEDHGSILTSAEAIAQLTRLLLAPPSSPQ